MTHGILVRPTGDTLLLRYPDGGDISTWIEKQIGGAPEKFSIGAGLVAFSRSRGPLNEPVRRILSENAAVHGDALVLKLAKRRKRMGIANGFSLDEARSVLDDLIDLPKHERRHL